MTRTSFQVLFATLLTALVLAGPVRADDLEYVIRGVEEPMLGNVRAFVSPLRFAGTGRLTPRRLEQLRAGSETDARVALRPFGYYHAPNRYIT